MIDFDFAETTLVANQTLSEIGSFNINNGNAQKSLILTRVSLFDLGAIDSATMGDAYEYSITYVMKNSNMVDETPIASGNVDECINLSTNVYDDPDADNPVAVNALTAIGVGATLNVEDIDTSTIVSPLFTIFGRVKTSMADGTQTLGDELTLCNALQVNRNVVFGYGLASKLRFVMHWNNTLFRRPNGVEVVAEYKSQYLSTQTFQSWLDKYNLNSRLDYDYVKRNISMYAGGYESAQEAMLMSVQGNRFRLRSNEYSRTLKSKALLSHKDVRNALNDMTSALYNGEYSESRPQFNYHEYMFVLKVLEDSEGNVCLACFSYPIPINYLKCGSPVAYRRCKLFVLPSGSGTPVIRELPRASYEITSEDDGSYDWKNLYLPRECLVGGITKDGLTFTVQSLDVKFAGTSGGYYYMPMMRSFKWTNVFSDRADYTTPMFDSSQSDYGDWFAYSAVHNDGESLFWLAPISSNDMRFIEARRDGTVNDYIIVGSQSDAWRAPTTFGCRIVLNGAIHPVIVTRYNVAVFEIQRQVGTNTWGKQYWVGEAQLSGLFDYNFEIPESRNVIGCQSNGTDICIQQLNMDENEDVFAPYYFTVINSNGYTDELGMVEDIDDTLNGTCAGQTTLHRFGAIGIGSGGSMLGVSSTLIRQFEGSTTVDVVTQYHIFTIRASEYLSTQTRAFATRDSYDLTYKFEFNAQNNSATSLSLRTTGDLNVSSYYPTYFEYEKIGASIIPI